LNSIAGRVALVAILQGTLLLVGSQETFNVFPFAIILVMPLLVFSDLIDKEDKERKRKRLERLQERDRGENRGA
jgi:hypothetical protein